MDSKDQNYRYIVLFLKPHELLLLNAVWFKSLSSTSLFVHQVIKKVYRLKDSINKEPLNVFNMSVSICWEDTTQLILKVRFKA